jgi:hypothetical protein
MSGNSNNPYPRQHHGGSQNSGNNNYNRNTTNYNGNGNGNGNNGNGNDNNYHLRNPYSPHSKKTQQQQQQQQSNPPRYNINQGNSSDSRRPFNPYSQKAQQQQPQQPNPNQYSNTSNSNSSFAISPAQPQEYQQQQQQRTHVPVPVPVAVEQHQQQQQYGQEQSHRSNTNSAIGNDNNNNNNNNSISHDAQPQTTQQQQQDQNKLLLDHLKDQLDQSNESNFELEASVMALGAELQHTTQALKDQANRERSKLEHELRLAQQESKRWKLLAQQHQSPKGRSIVRDATAPSASASAAAAASLEAVHPLLPQQGTITNTTGAAFSNRLLGDPAGLKPSSTKATKKGSIGGAGIGVGVGAQHSYEEEFVAIDTPGSPHQTRPPKLAPAAAHTGSNHPPPSQQQDLPVARLARNLLEQLEPRSTASTRRNSRKTTTSNKKQGRPEEANTDAKASKLTSKSTPTSTPMDVEKGDTNDQQNANDDDTSIRRVLFSIASAGRGTKHSSISTGNSSINNNDNDCLDATLFMEQQVSPPTVWTEGKLVEWLVRTSSSESSDRYWSTLLLQSPEARKHIMKNISLDWDGQGWNSGKEDHHLQQQQQQHPFGHHEPLRRRRRGRIRPLLSEDNKENNDVAKLEERQQQIRRSLRNPWWNPGDGAYSDQIHKGCQTSESNTNGAAIATTKATQPMSSSPSSSLVFRKWVVSLAASRNLRHLHTLRVLLAEEAGRKGLAIPTRPAYGGGEESQAGAWWALCYTSIATTIQRISYRRLIRSKTKKNRGGNGFTSASAATTIGGNRSNNPRNSSATNNNNNESRRYRIGRFEDRLEKLPEAGRVMIIEKEGATAAAAAATTMAMTIEIDGDDSLKPSAKDLEQNKEGIVKKRRSIRPDGKKGTADLGSREEEEEEDKILTLALSVWVGLLQVASSEQIEAWYEDRNGLCAADKLWQKKNNNNYKKKQSNGDSSQPCGGIFMVCLLLDLLEELQFGRWMCEDSSANALSPSQLMSTGVLPSETNRHPLAAKNHKGKKNPAGVSNKGNQQSCDDGPPSSSTILPQWYGAAIAVLSQVGRTQEGMRVLRARTMDDPENSDWMGNTLDVSIRQLHALALHLDDIRTRHGSILRLGECTCGSDERSKEGYPNRDDPLWGGDPEAANLLRSVEAWVRLWHQILLYAQSRDGISFRSLVLDLQDWFTSSCTTLLASEEVRREIKAMIRWQLDELMMDEEDYEESQRNLGQR